MRRRLSIAVLRIAPAVRVGAAISAFAAGLWVLAGAAGAKPYGRGEDLLLRLDPWYGEPLWAVTWMFYALAVFVGGWAILRFKTHFDAPQTGGLVTPVVGIAFAVALATVPMPIDALVDGPPPGYRPPVWRGSDSYAPMTDDLLYRPGPSFQEVWGLAAWVLYLPGIIAGGWAILRFGKHFDARRRGEAPARGGLAAPVAGALVALALLASPWLVTAFVDGLSLEYRPPILDGSSSDGVQRGEGGGWL